jgi:hypothetical protein
MLYIKISFAILPEKQKEFEQAVPWLVHSNVISEEDVKQQILRDSRKPASYVYLGECETREKLECLLRSERFRALWGGMKLLGKITEAKIMTSDRVEDLEPVH